MSKPLQLSRKIDVSEVEGLAWRDGQGNSLPVGHQLLPLVPYPICEHTFPNDDRPCPFANLDEMAAISATGKPHRQDQDEAAKILIRRNFRTIEWLRWRALEGQVTIEFANRDNCVYVDYGFDLGSRPTTTIVWTDHENADYMADLQAWVHHMRTKQLGTKQDPYEGKVQCIMNTVTYREAYLNDRRRDIMASHVGVPGAPSSHLARRDIEPLIDDNFEFVFNDAGQVYHAYSDEDGATNEFWRYVPDGRVFLTTDPKEMPFGRVLYGPALPSDNEPGHHAGIWYDPKSKWSFVRAISNVLPIIDNPQCVMCCTAY